MTNRLKLKDEEEKVVADWKFAAMVIDRWDHFYHLYHFNNLCHFDN